MCTFGLVALMKRYGVDYEMNWDDSYIRKDNEG